MRISFPGRPIFKQLVPVLGGPQVALPDGHLGVPPVVVAAVVKPVVLGAVREGAEKSVLQCKSEILSDLLEGLTLCKSIETKFQSYHLKITDSHLKGSCFSSWKS